MNTPIVPPTDAKNLIQKLGVYEEQWQAYAVPLDTGEVAIITEDEIFSDPEGAMLKAVGMIDCDCEFQVPLRKIEL